ncbi:hypothetical protein T484DRAFT_1765768 [Baffinella frigidus]|nr:hypothetical protein T484DRAFT_1765768 [Cryptophyta sp. CCMP2293]
MQETSLHGSSMMSQHLPSGNFREFAREFAQKAMAPINAALSPQGQYDWLGSGHAGQAPEQLYHS